MRSALSSSTSSKFEHVVEQLKRKKTRTPVSIRKKAVSHQVPKRNDARHTDDKIGMLSALDAILEIDPGRHDVHRRSPASTFTDLVRRRRLPAGFVPVVVPELETITIGGAVSGCSLESTSFKYGGFHDTCLEYEVITARGDVLRCTPDNAHRLVFQMMHGSFGTLGILSKLKFRLLPAKPFVRVAYETYPTLEEYSTAIAGRFDRRDVDFMDGIIHTADKYVLSLGEFVDAAPYTHKYDWVKVYYETTARRKEDYFKTPDYFFRYDRGVTNVHPKSAVGRLLFGKFMDSARLLRIAEKFHRFLPAEKPKVTLDVFVPVFSKLTEFMTLVHAAPSATSRCGACPIASPTTTSGSRPSSSRG